jgi:acetyltransferase-like isoleucine patch superfamily enzyme
MTAANPSSSKQGIKSFLLKHGLELDGTIGNGVVWEPPVKIYHSSRIANAEIGAYSYVSPCTEIRHARIGRYCSIGDNVNMRGSAHPKTWLSSHPFPYTNLYPGSRSYRPPLTFDGYSRRTIIGHDVWIGSQAIILPGVTIGTGAIIGAGAVVAKDIPAYAVAVGNPARVVKYRFERDLIDRLLQSEWWLYDLPRYLEQQPGVPLAEPEKMIDFLTRHDNEIERISPVRKRYMRTKDRITVQNVRQAGT